MIIECKNLSKNFIQGNEQINIVNDLNFSVKNNDFISIVGESGSGKTTFLNLMSGLERPSSGSVIFNGDDINNYDEYQLSDFRANKIGFIFQSHHLLSEFTILENLLIPLQLSKFKTNDFKELAIEVLDKVGLLAKLDAYPTSLSGGERQRVSIARALIKKPKVIFADEPTGNLDMNNSKKILDLFYDLRDFYKLTLVLVTHNISITKNFSKCYEMVSGKLNEL